jgi:hypothetical protein
VELLFGNCLPKLEVHMFRGLGGIPLPLLGGRYQDRSLPEELILRTLSVNGLRTTVKVELYFMTSSVNGLRTTVKVELYFMTSSVNGLRTTVKVELYFMTSIVNGLRTTVESTA